MEQQYLTAAQLKCIKTLVGKLKPKDFDAVVIGTSYGRTESVSELYGTEASALIRHLKSLDPDEAVAEKMRRKIIGLAYERAGLSRNASKTEKQGVVNWLNGWCKQYGYKHKALNSYTMQELPKLVSQFEQVYKDLLINI